MQVKDWLLGLEKHSEALAAFFKSVTGSEVEVSVADVDRKNAEETALLLADDEMAVRAVDEVFQSEVLFTFSSGALLPLTRSLTNHEVELSEELGHNVLLTITEKLIEHSSRSLLGAGIETRFSEVELIPTGKTGSSLNQQQYYTAKFAVKGSFGEFQLGLAAGEANHGRVEAVIEEWQDENPFLNEDFVSNSIAIFADTRLKIGGFADEGESSVQVKGKRVEFEAFDKRKVIDNDREITNIDLLKDVEMGLSVELGRREMPLGKILQLVKGSVIELERMAGEPVDILVNGHTIATGDVVVIDDYFGVRITQLHEENFNFRS
jgi:flagellar motor switch protein FliN